MTREEAIEIVVEHARQRLATYEDRGHDYNSCESCDWNSKTHDWNTPHPETCELTQAIRLLGDEPCEHASTRGGSAYGFTQCCDCGHVIAAPPEVLSVPVVYR